MTTRAIIRQGEYPDTALSLPILAGVVAATAAGIGKRVAVGSAAVALGLTTAGGGASGTAGFAIS